MTDYKKLIKELRDLAQPVGNEENAHEDIAAFIVNGLTKKYKDAADAIEELQAKTEFLDDIWGARCCRIEKENERLKKQLDLMAHYIVEFGKVDYFLCDNIPQEIHLKHQPKNDGNYDNAPCIECVKEYFATRGENNNITSK